MKTSNPTGLSASKNSVQRATRYGLFHRNTGKRVWANYEFTSLTQAAIFIITHDLHAEAKPL